MPGRPEMILHNRSLLRQLMAGRDDTVTLAEKVGVSKQAIGYLTSGARNSCRTETAERIVGALGCDLGDLFRSRLEEDSSDKSKGGADVVHTVPEASKALRVSKTTVYRLIGSGDLVSIDVSPPGSRKAMRRVPDSAIRAFLADRAAQS